MVKEGGDGEDGGGSVELCASYRCSSSTNSGRPSWLQVTLAGILLSFNVTDLDVKMKTLALNLHVEDDSDSFSERAENYYLKRPQLLNLLQDLYNGYLSLADRYCQTLIKQHPPRQSSISNILFEIEDDNGTVISDSVSEAESSLSYQTPPPTVQRALTPPPPPTDSDTIIAELITKTIDYEFLIHEIQALERTNTESSRKMDLQKSLLEVLESERLILLNENSRLGYRVTTLSEENKGLASDSIMMKRKAGELARCVLKMREDHRMSLLNHKIEDLQGKIDGLEKRNQEREEEEKKRKKRDVVALEVCFEVEKLKVENQRLKEESLMMKKGGVLFEGLKVSTSKWWDRVKKMDLMFVCGPNATGSSKYSCC
ncbi:hypothetical protein GIB67_012521 [Kingdonia uniflora]|uniref:NAB domain-containing protein n=1 Tax=Kingdonia uniflora TaxID=39325 RepID=A0A7J7MDK0_9MAGN|nr:hypothetical protein GIB67_012521 [Kingdonia uniflora]